VSAPVLDLVVPVHDEEHVLGAAVRRLHDHLEHVFPYPFRITVADNASTDRTPEVAADLAAELPHVHVVRLEQKGRGRALAQVWSASDAHVLAYCDVDLSTDLDALLPLVAPLLSGHSDLAIGTRLHRDSRVVRGLKREAISRCYNLVLRSALGASFSDAQCGFKAIRADVAAVLLPLVEDRTWFFDTELLVLAQRSGLRIHEVPVDWYDDPDSRVDVVATARDDLRGVWRLHRAFSAGSLPTEEIRARLGRTTPMAGVGAQTIRFGLVGVMTTGLHLGLFAVLASYAGFASQAANVLALVLATVVNTSANRRWTFGIRGPRHAARHQLQGLGVFAATWAMTAGALLALGALWPGAPTPVQTLVVGAATVVSTVVKFVLMRSWMFAPAPAGSPRANASTVERASV
jgi:putative flippase GtrA